MKQQTSIQLVLPNASVLVELAQKGALPFIGNLADEVDLLVTDVAVAELEMLDDRISVAVVQRYLGEHHDQVSFLRTSFSELLAARHVLPSIPWPKNTGELVIYDLFAQDTLTVSMASSLCVLPDSWLAKNEVKPSMLIPLPISTLTRYCNDVYQGSKIPLWDYLN